MVVWACDAKAADAGHRCLALLPTHTMTMSPIGSVLRAAADLQRAVKMLLVAAFSLLCAVCTEASADCRGEVAAAFERLRASGRPYRKDVTFVVSDQQTFRGTAEFLPPDRMREITNNGVAGDGTFETIQVGQRAWSSPGGWPWGWREWDPRLMQTIFEKAKDFSTLRDPPIPQDAIFECLGRVEFKGTAYLGYRARVDKTIVTVSPLSQERFTVGPSTEERDVAVGPFDSKTTGVSAQISANAARVAYCFRRPPKHAPRARPRGSGESTR
jgi:hypothetical protein